MLCGCRCSPAQTVDARVDGHDVRFTHAYGVSHGGRSLELHLANRDRGCAWATGHGLGVILDDDAHLSLDVAPVTRSDGTAWRVVGGGWVVGESLGHGIGNLGFERFDAEVAPTEGGHRVTVHVAHVDVRLDGSFVAEDCTPELTPAPDEPIPPIDAPMILMLGNERHPLTRASLTTGPAGQREVRISRGLEPCRDEVTHEDVYVSIESAGAIAEPMTLRVEGQVSEPLFTFLRDEPLQVRLEGRPPDERLHVETDRLLYEDWMARERPVRVRIHGDVPVTRCRD